MRKLLSLLTLICLFTFVSCTKGKVTTTTYVFYASMVVYNNTNYYLSSEVVPSENLDKQIGTVKKQVTPSPQNNEDANECPVGTEIFSIKGTDIKEAIVVNYNNEYYKATTQH
jgi:hypothetical protein